MIDYEKNPWQLLTTDQRKQMLLEIKLVLGLDYSHLTDGALKHVYKREIHEPPKPEPHR